MEVHPLRILRDMPNCSSVRSRILTATTLAGLLEEAVVDVEKIATWTG